MVKDSSQNIQRSEAVAELLPYMCLPDTQQQRNWAWSHTPVIPEFEAEAGKAESRGHLWLHLKFKTGWGYKRPCLKKLNKMCS